MPNIRHALLIGAPVEKVFSALTTQEGLSAWWTPDVKATPELGSIARFAFGPTYCKEMKITELTPPTFLKWNCFAGAEDEWIGTSISFKLEGGDRDSLLRSHREITDQIQQGSGEQQTLLVMQHDDWRDYTLMFAECSYTWGQFMRGLKSYCETGKGKPWPGQHRAA